MIQITENIEMLCSMENLKAAWLAVASKNSAPGIDNVSVNMFARNLEENLRNLHKSISEERYTPQPLIVFPKEKRDHSFREITIPAISDKIVAKTVADFEGQRFNSSLAPQSYAYRPHRSATKAVTVVEQNIRRSDINYVARIDIKEFFDSMNHSIMRNMLTQYGNPEKVVELIMKFATNRRFDGVRLITPDAGVPQGSPIAPVISNLYLDYFDKIMNENGISFLRYADDILIFAKDTDEAANSMNLAIRTLNSLSLEISLDKSRVYQVAKGFIFLGFLFSENGKTPCQEAKDRLSDKISAPQYDDETDDEYNKRINSVVRGWKNYFYFDRANMEEREAAEKKEAEVSPVEVADSEEGEIAYSGGQTDTDKVVSDDTISSDELLQDIENLILLEREQEAIRKIRFLLSGEYELSDTLYKRMNAKLAELYEKLGLCGAADRCRKNIGEYVESRYKKSDSLVYGTENIEKWMEIFFSDSYIYRQYVDRVGRMGYKPASKKLNPAYLKDHWLGKHTLAVPVFDKKNEVHFAVMDFDISRRQIDTLTLNEISALKSRLLDDARGVLDIAFKAGVKGLLEDSGYKGYHIWFFFYKRIPAKLAKDFLQALNKIAGNPPEGTHRELFPASDVLKNDQLNSRIKLPLGLHRLSGHYSKFLKPDGTVSENGILALSSNIFFNRCASLKGAIRDWNEFRTSEPSIEDRDSELKNNGGKIEQLFGACGVLRAIKQKAETKRNLSHYERVVLRGILAPLGEEGRAAIHDVMRNCNNYSKSMTDKMLADDRSKPMGCRRIREILSYMTQRVGCNCKFRKTKNDYSHPLRHLKSKNTPTKVSENDSLIADAETDFSESIAPEKNGNDETRIDVMKHESRSTLNSSNIKGRGETMIMEDNDIFRLALKIGPVRFNINLNLGRK